MASFALRPARLGDALAMANLHHAAVRALQGGPYRDDVLERWAPGVTVARAERLFRETQDEGGRSLIAEAGDEVIGFAVAMPGAAALSACYVAHAAAGNGVGRTLVGAFEDEARDAGVSTFDVRAPLNATGFYARLGYAAERTATFAFGDGSRCRSSSCASGSNYSQSRAAQAPP
jgi:GNAT superfamily N-acetyltransferase